MGQKWQQEYLILKAATDLVAFSLLVLAIVSCKAKPSASNVSYIIGPSNDITSVSPENSESVPADIFNATGLIVTKLQGDRVKFCSGALAQPEKPGGNLRVITNHHCFAITDERGMSSDQLLVEACTGTEIFLGFAPLLGRAPQRGSCKPGSLRTNPTMDLAVFTLAKPLPSYNQPLQIWDGDPVPEGRSAMIVHYPDIDQNMAIPPGQRTKLPTASITNTDCKIGGMFAPSEWDLDQSLPFGLRHTCDLIHGSSGSPLIDAETKKIVGINWGGIKIKTEGAEKTDNVATRAVFLNQFLLGSEGPTNSNANQALDAIAAQRAASATTPKKQAKMPLGCGVTSNSSHSNAPLTLLFLIPLLACIFGKKKSMATITVILITAGFFLSESKGFATTESNSAAINLTSTQLILNVFSLEFLTLERTPAIESRAKFAVIEAKKRNLTIIESEAIASKVLSAHSTNADKTTHSIDAIKSTYASADLPNWVVLSQKFIQQSAFCPNTKADLDSYIAGNARSETQRLKLIESWKGDRIACLLTTLAAIRNDSNSNSAYDPLPLVENLIKTNHRLADPASASGKHLLLISALRYLEQSNYSECLRALVLLQDHEPSWKLIYNSVQRIYNYRQKGKGAVALNQ